MGLLAIFVPKRGSVVWERAEVSPAVVSIVIYALVPFVVRISFTVGGGSGRVMYALSNVELVTTFCHKCVGL